MASHRNVIDFDPGWFCHGCSRKVEVARGHMGHRAPWRCQKTSSSPANRPSSRSPVRLTARHTSHTMRERTHLVHFCAVVIWKIRVLLFKEVVVEYHGTLHLRSECATTVSLHIDFSIEMRAAFTHNMCTSRQRGITRYSMYHQHWVESVSKITQDLRCSLLPENEQSCWHTPILSLRSSVDMIC